MQDINKRFKEIREFLGQSQEAFGDSIGLSKSGISNIEKGDRNVTNKHIKMLSLEHNVNEQWLRTGDGEMFVEPETFSLDEYAKKNSLTPLELDIIKGYMALSKDTRQDLMEFFRSTFNKHAETAATIEDYQGFNKEQYINEKVSSYRTELEDTLKVQTSSVLPMRKGGC